MSTRTIQNCLIRKTAIEENKGDCGTDNNGKCNGYTSFGYLSVCKACKLCKDYTAYCKDCGTRLNKGGRYCENCLQIRNRDSNLRFLNRNEGYGKNHRNSNKCDRKKYQENYWIERKRKLSNLNPVSLCKKVLSGEIEGYPKGYWTCENSKQNAFKILDFLFKDIQNINYFKIKEYKIRGMFTQVFGSDLSLLVNEYKQYSKQSKPNLHQ